ncbi:M48 family metalloprotease [Pontimicrobium sp. MEBiC01747]|jgi:hypothetical protein
MKVSLITLSFLILSVVFGNAQIIENEYIPKELDSIKKYLKRINSNQIREIKGAFSSKIKKIYKGRDEKTIEKIEDSVYYFNKEVKNNLDAILNHIYTSNPNINTKDFCFFINNSLAPNAACYGDGMFEINLGLFTVLDSDDELASIICHEIAHKLLRHSINNVTNSVATINSRETRVKVKKIKRKKYGRTRAALSIIDELSVKILDHSQTAEAEADSLGYILLSKTKYAKSNAVSALVKLKKVDDMMLYHDVRLDSVFNFESYPFKSYWLKKTASIFNAKEKIDEFKLESDTIETHPELELRVKKLNKNFNIPDSSSAISQRHLKEIKKIAYIQSIEYVVDLKLLDLAIYQLIEKYDNKKITTEYYYSTMAKVFKKIYKARKKHELAKYVRLSNNFSDEKQLNSIRRFIHNLELSEIRKIGLAFCKSNKDKLPNNKDFNEIHDFFESIN